MDTREAILQPEKSAVGREKLRTMSELPSPKSWPVIGHTFQIRTDSIHLQLEQWSRELGHYYKIKVANRHYLVVSDHKATAKAMRERPDRFSRSKRLKDVWSKMQLKIGLFGAEGEVWRKQRRMVMAAFDPSHVRAYFPSLCKVADRLESRWKKSAGTDIDLTAELMRFTVDAITGLAFGQESNTLESADDIIQDHLDKLFPMVFKRLISPLQLWRYIRLPADRALDRSIVEINAAIDGFVAKARERMAQHPELRDHPGNLLEAMISAADQGDSGLNDNDVAGNVLTMLLAGEDTTANSLAWLLSLLWDHPEIMQKLQLEVRSKFAIHSAYDMEKLAELDYLDACINESMRLKPVAPFLGMQALTDTVIGDVEVPAHTMIFALLRHDSVDADFIPQAAEFIPERWLDNGTAVQSINSVKRISMPFGAGPRICPGRYLALLEMKIAMAMLLTRFDIEDISAPAGKAPRELMSFTMVPVGLKMRLKSRN